MNDHFYIHVTSRNRYNGYKIINNFQLSNRWRTHQISVLYAIIWQFEWTIYPAWICSLTWLFMWKSTINFRICFICLGDPYIHKASQQLLASRLWVIIYCSYIELSLRWWIIYIELSLRSWVVTLSYLNVHGQSHRVILTFMGSHIELS